MTTLRWGFLSTAKIGRTNWAACRESGRGVVTAVASRDEAKARAFVEACQGADPFASAPVALGGYEALLARDDVDAVYVPLPTGMRRAWVIRAAEAGRHVLCEKPCAVDAADLEAMVAACRANGVLFMDGVMFMHHPRLARLTEVMGAGVAVGRVRNVQSQLSFRADEAFMAGDIRVDAALEPAGCLGDLGWYCIRVTLCAMGGRMPVEASGRILLERAGVPLEFAGQMRFADGACAGFYCSFTGALQQWATVSGTAGALRMDDFIHPAAADRAALVVNAVPEWVVNGRRGVGAGEAGGEGGGGPRAEGPLSQQAQMFRTFADCVEAGAAVGNPWPDWALRTQRVMDACLASARRTDAPGAAVAVGGGRGEG